jgi:hypothetical protein
LTAAPDGWLASAGWDDTVRVWDPAAGTATHILTGHIGTVQALTVAGDGSWLASGGHDKTVRIWNLIRSDVESLKPAGHSAGGSHATSASRSMKAAHTRSGEAAITREAVSVRALGGIVMTGSAAPPVIQLCVPIADPTAEAAPNLGLTASRHRGQCRSTAFLAVLEAMSYQVATVCEPTPSGGQP